MAIFSKFCVFHGEERKIARDTPHSIEPWNWDIFPDKTIPELDESCTHTRCRYIIRWRERGRYELGKESGNSCWIYWRTWIDYSKKWVCGRAHARTLCTHLSRSACGFGLLLSLYSKIKYVRWLKEPRKRLMLENIRDDDVIGSDTDCYEGMLENGYNFPKSTQYKFVEILSAIQESAFQEGTNLELYHLWIV